MPRTGRFRRVIPDCQQQLPFGGFYCVSAALHRELGFFCWKNAMPHLSMRGRDFIHQPVGKATMWLQLRIEWNIQPFHSFTILTRVVIGEGDDGLGQKAKPKIHLPAIQAK